MVLNFDPTLSSRSPAPPRIQSRHHSRVALCALWGATLLAGPLATPLTGAGCTKPVSRKASTQASSTGQAGAGLTGGQLVFADSFDRAILGGDWESSSPVWRIDGGTLVASNAKNDGCWLRRELPDNTRVEFDATADSAEGDLKFEIFATHREHQAGYIGILGGWKNSVSIVARLDEHGTDRLETRSKVAEKGKAYRFAIVRINGSFDWYIDGTHFLRYEDEEPVRGQYFGFNDWTAPIRFDNVAIFELPPS